MGTQWSFNTSVCGRRHKSLLEFIIEFRQEIISDALTSPEYGIWNLLRNLLGNLLWNWNWNFSIWSTRNLQPVDSGKFLWVGYLELLDYDGFVLFSDVHSSCIVLGFIVLGAGLQL